MKSLNFIQAVSLIGMAVVLNVSSVSAQTAGGFSTGTAITIWTFEPASPRGLRCGRIGIWSIAVRSWLRISNWDFMRGIHL